MAIQFSKSLLDGIAPDLSSFGPSSLTSLEQEALASKNWIVFYGMGQTIGPRFHTAMNASVLRQFFRRVSAAVESYELMRGSLIKYFDNYILDSPRFSHYFDALNSIEICMLQLQIAAESLNKSIFEGKCDFRISGNEFRKCFALSNQLKHFGERSQNGNTSSTMPVWFLSEGVTDGVNRIRFDEVFDMVQHLYKLGIIILAGKPEIAEP